MEALRREALSCYRRLLKAQRVVFAGDDSVLRAAHGRTRSEFEANRSLSTEAAMKQKIEEAKGITQFLTQNLVQGRLEDGKGVFKVKVEGRLEMWDYQRNGRPSCGCC